MEANPTQGMENTARPQPVRRLNSKENPFLPGGDLDKETDDLLKKAVIVRDQFLLAGEQGKSPQKSAPASPPTGYSEVVQEEHLTPANASPAKASPVNASPVSKSRENGQSGEQVSPASVKVEVNKDAPRSPGSPQTKSDVPKEKKKGKCCSIM